MSRHRSYRKRRKSAWIAAAVVCVILAAALLIAGGLWIRSEMSYQEPIPTGTPNQNPTVDQKPVPSSSSDASQSASASSGSSASGSAQSASSGSSSSAAQESSSSAEEPLGEQVVRGVITDASMSQITIDADGKTLSFWRETADVTGRIVEGATVDIYYTGSINGTDTSAVYVTRIVSFS